MVQFTTTILSIFTIALTFTTSTYATPLNINLGAYSPAVVVGDGALSFGAAAKEGAAAAAPAAAANGAPAQAQITSADGSVKIGKRS